MYHVSYIITFKAIKHICVLSKISSSKSQNKKYARFLVRWFGASTHSVPAKVCGCILPLPRVPFPVVA